MPVMSDGTLTAAAPQPPMSLLLGDDGLVDILGSARAQPAPLHEPAPAGGCVALRRPAAGGDSAPEGWTCRSGGPCGGIPSRPGPGAPFPDPARAPRRRARACRRGARACRRGAGTSCGARPRPRTLLGLTLGPRFPRGLHRVHCGRLIRRLEDRPALGAGDVLAEDRLRHAVARRALGARDAQHVLVFPWSTLDPVRTGQRRGAARAVLASSHCRGRARQGQPVHWRARRSGALQ